MGRTRTSWKSDLLWCSTALTCTHRCQRRSRHSQRARLQAQRLAGPELARLAVPAPYQLPTNSHRRHSQRRRGAEWASWDARTYDAPLTVGRGEGPPPRPTHIAQKNCVR